MVVIDMIVFDVVFGEDIILDEAAFNAAIADFVKLSEQLQNLRTELQNMINDLKEGFDTPAGAKFFKLYEDKLLKPMADQKLVLDHISTTLIEAKTAYNQVFSGYSELQETIDQLADG